MNSLSKKFICVKCLIFNLFSENFILFEVLSLTENNEEHLNQEIALDDIPKKLKLSMMTQEYYLKGLISFDPPRMLRKQLQRNDEKRIGHYKTFCLRNGNWTEINYRLTHRRKNYTVNPHIIMYSL